MFRSHFDRKMEKEWQEELARAGEQIREYFKDFRYQDYRNLHTVLEEESSEMTFDDALNMCDYEIQIRYDYLDELLCELDEEIMTLITEIAKLEVDYDIAKLTSNRNSMCNIESKIKLKKITLDKLEAEYEAVYNLYDEVFLGILANME